MKLLIYIKKFLRRFLVNLKALIGKELSINPEVTITSKYIGDNKAGWFIHPKILNSESIIYAVGVGENISFDLSLIDLFGCNVYAFDPTPKSLLWLKTQKTPDQFLVFDYGLADFDGNVEFYAPENPTHVSHTLLNGHFNNSSIKVPVKKLFTIMSDLAHNKIDLLKLDIEGAEYSVIDNLLREKIEVSQILIEFHHRFKDIGLEQSEKAIQKLRGSGYKLFHVSSNREEYSFIREDLIE